MAWPVYVSEEAESPEPSSDVSSSTDHVNVSTGGPQAVHVEGVFGISSRNERQMESFNQSSAARYLQNPLERRQQRILNPHLDRLRNGRSYSCSDIRQHYGEQAPGTHQNSALQRHSLPCCHINHNVHYGCCLHFGRRSSLESSDLHMRNFLRNGVPGSTQYRRCSSQAVLGATGQFSSAESNSVVGARVNAEYERQRSFSVSQSFLFSNSVDDRYFQQAVFAVRPEFFMRFLADQMEQRGLQLPEDLRKDMGCCNQIPESFCYLIDRFSASLEREMVFCLAMRVQFPVSLNSFVFILDGLNKGTLSPESIVTLFFFCGDLAIRAFCENKDVLFRDLVSWTQWYLRRIDSLVVPAKKSSFKIAVTACIVGIVAIFVIMKRC